MREIYDLSREHGLSVHLDGARIFNAAVATGCPVTDFTRYADSVTVCLSKGLSAPVGSLLAGTREFVTRARKARKLVGGGMRQAGVLAAAGIMALEKMVDRLAEDHVNAKRLAGGLAVIPGIIIDPRWVQTNIVSYELAGITDGEFLMRLRDRGVLAGSSAPQRIRMVANRMVSAADIETALEAVQAVMLCGS
jgi:threonine aldolase